MIEQSIYKILERNRNRKSSKQSLEYDFFNKNKYLLKENTFFNKYLDAVTPFEIIRANIIIGGLKNKEEIDEIVLAMKKDATFDLESTIKEKYLDLPSFYFDKLKIYFPFFSKVTNDVYSNEVNKLFEPPYLDIFNDYSSFLVNPFDTYGIDLFDSTFTRLVKIDEDITSVAFYSYHLGAILIINKQGGLDNIIYLFDKYLKHPNKSHIMDRVKHLIGCYYKNNIHDFVYSLYKNEFISYKVFKKICKAKKI